MKAIMAVTGLCLIGFLLMHMFGNTKLLLPDNGAEFNEYSEYLRRFLYPIVPPMWFLWAFRVFLLACIVLHMWSAAQLTGRKGRNVGGARYANKKNMESSFAARTMIWSGIILVLGLVMHLLHYTAQVLRPGYAAGVTDLDPFHRVLAGFSEWWVVLAYLVFMIAVCTHIFHGCASAFMTLGANVSAGSRKTLKSLSAIIAILLFIGFMVPPVMILTGVIGR
ncbi:MAG: succinate dehydrogenase cytochrome b subunit [Luteococcus sp.]|uniref:succinate dehydrogenase cytochrome b subunit n=1 Tax=Luteococcus sp. TaxID=1969402 RepID=UPI002647D111|nr:succinate dehydrogenase cytochrome b subunit [Luteococcus sp.]MDN5563968.1 succinate dehydrogenase cytochrome b subunit [Luteococcus sp.]